MHNRHFILIEADTAKAAVLSLVKSSNPDEPKEAQP
jgi:hypothetical protein